MYLFFPYSYHLSLRAERADSNTSSCFKCNKNLCPLSVSCLIKQGQKPIESARDEKILYTPLAVVWGISLYNHFAHNSHANMYYQSNFTHTYTYCYAGKRGSIASNETKCWNQIFKCLNQQSNIFKKQNFLMSKFWILTTYYIDTQKSAVFNWFGWDENCKYLKKIDFCGFLQTTVFLSFLSFKYLYHSSYL